MLRVLSGEALEEDDEPARLGACLGPAGDPHHALILGVDHGNQPRVQKQTLHIAAWRNIEESLYGGACTIIAYIADVNVYNHLRVDTTSDSKRP